jgi:glycosyltransferase involved in cell wall biosynthesis
MRILVLAPHPFYQDRGTPIDVLLVLRVLTSRPNTQVDLVTYHEGEPVDLPNLRIYRSWDLPGLENIRPGFSAKKLIADVGFFFTAWQLVRTNHYDIIHAGEEAVFFAMLFKRLYGIPFAYDLDSSIAQQLVEKKPYLRAFSGLFDRMEGQAIRESLINFPVCNALADLCTQNGSSKTVTLHDISQLDDPDQANPERLHQEKDFQGPIFLYSGNLEPYQGIDLLLESFSRALDQNPDLNLVIIGGNESHIAQYRAKASRLGIAHRTFFLGPRPFDQLGDYLAGADVLVCPRIKGINTPMKIFPYLHSGRPVLATDLRTHNQILTSNEAYLAPADPEGFAKGMLDLANDPSLRERLGRQGRAFVEQNHTYEAHRSRLNKAYDWIEAELGKA